MMTIAEGVETPDQYEDLVKGGCNTVQGYYIAKPMAPDTIESFMRSMQTASITPVE